MNQLIKIVKGPSLSLQIQVRLVNLDGWCSPKYSYEIDIRYRKKNGRIWHTVSCNDFEYGFGKTQLDVRAEVKKAKLEFWNSLKPEHD